MADLGRPADIHGLAMHTSVLQAQSTQLTAEDNLAQSRAALTADLVAVYKALGGGWKRDDLTASSRGDDALFEQ